MLRPERALKPTPMDGVVKRHGGDVASRAGRACSALEESRWQQLLRRVARPLAAFAALIATEVETVAQETVVAGVEAVSALKPLELNPVGIDVPIEFASLDPAGGFGNIAKDSFFASSSFRARSNTVKSPGKFGAWTVDRGDVGLHINDFAVKDAFGNAVDLNGTRSGSIMQSIKVKAGVQYRIRFQMSGNWTTFPGRPRSLSVFFGNEKATFTMDKPGSWSRANMHWETKTIDFVAKQDGIGLRFSSNTDGIADGPVISQVEVFSPLSPPGALDSLPVPLPPNLMDFVADKDKAIALGKAFFWDMQVGSDGRTACATCHWHAGADVRTVNTANPGKSGSLFRGVNKTLKSSDFPFHKFKDPTVPGDSVSNPVIADVREVIGSQGVITANFAGVKSGSAIDMTVGKVLNPTFMSQYSNVRQATGRNAPSTVNAVFFDRSFWDGRANRYFNGVNPFGELDSNARVLKANAAGQLESVQIQLDNGALASQAVGPANSDVEMAWTGRSFAELGRKMLSLRPLSQQKVAVDDSVLGIYLDSSGRGLDLNQAAYAKLIREAFLPEWWSGVAKTSDGYTQMEANFSLYWGLAIMMYESTLVSDQAPYDKYARGDKDALTAKAKEGLRIFVKEGKCLHCHHGPEFAGGTVSNLRGVLSEDGGVSLMKMAQGIAFYDEGFYNIGVRPTTEDLGVGGSHPLFGPLSYGRQEQAGRNPDPGDVVTPDQRVAVDGAFKAPTLRNVELTGPYMHNGSMKSLTEVVQFYARGSDFHDSNLKDLDTDVGGISALQGNPAAIASVVEFLEHLTDPRVKYQKAPFDHPELVLPNGHSALVSRVWLDNLLLLPETGKNGGSALSSFEDVLTNGHGLEALQMPQVPMSAEPATVVENTTPARTPPNATMLSQQALSKDALLGNRTSKVTATTEASGVPETAVVVGPEVPEPVATAEVVVPEAPAVVEVPEVVVPEAPAAVEVAETVANEGGVSLVKTPPTQELLAAKAAAKEALLGNRTSPVIAPEAPGAVEAPEAPEADGAAEVVVPEVPEVVEVAEPVANEGDVSLVKTPPTQELLDAKSEEKEELLGNRTSPEEKAELLSDRTSSITDPIAIGADDGDVPDAGQTDPAEEADPAEPVAPVDPAEEADPAEPVTPVDPAEESEAGESGTSLVKTPPTQELLDAKAEEKDELLGNRTDPEEKADLLSDRDSSITDPIAIGADGAAEVVVPEAPEADGAAEVVVPEAPEADDAAEVVVPEAPEVDEVAEPVTNEDGVSLVKTPPSQELLDAKAEEKDELLGNRTDPEEKADLLSDRDSSIIDPIAIGADDAAEVVVPEAPEADGAAEVVVPEAPEADGAAEVVVPEAPEVVEVAEPVANEGGVSPVKTPPTQELLDAKAAEKAALLGNRTSSIIDPIALNAAVAGEPVGKAALLGARNSKIVDPIALGATKAPAEVEPAAVVEAPAAAKKVAAEVVAAEVVAAEVVAAEVVAAEVVAAEVVAAEVVAAEVVVAEVVVAEPVVAPATLAEKATAKALLLGSRLSTTAPKPGVDEVAAAVEPVVVEAPEVVAVEPAIVAEARMTVTGKVTKVTVPVKSVKPVTTMGKPASVTVKPRAAVTKTTVPVSGRLEKPKGVK